MKTITKFINASLPVILLLSACVVHPEAAMQVTPRQNTEPAIQKPVSAQTEFVPSPEQPAGERNALTPPLTLESTSDEICEKMLSSFLNWQSMKVEAVWENNSLNPDNSIAYTVKYTINSSIDQESLRFRTEEQQIGSISLPKLAISDGTVLVSREVPWVIEGYPNRAASTYVYRVNNENSNEETLNLLHSGESIFSPMGEVYTGAIKSELFSSSFAVQYPGKYEGMEIESVAGRETLKVFYGDADRWGRSNLQYTLWIDTETGVVLKGRTDGIPDHFTESMEITRIVYNVPVDEKMFNTEEAMPDLNLDEMESDTVDGNTIYVDNLRVEDENVSLDVCYELPSDSDWMLYKMSAGDDEQINPNGYLIYLEPAGTLHEKGLRCDGLTFAYPFDGESLHIEIGQLFAPAREGDACSAGEMVSLALEEAGTPIEFTCVEDHGMTITEILSKPDVMTKEEARFKVDELFGQYRVAYLEGPWVFDLKRKE